MSYASLTKNGVDRAAPLDFPERKPAEPVTITAHVTFSGIHFEVCFTGQVDQLPAMAKRLVALGAEPVSAAAGIPAPSQATNGSSKPKAERVTPLYDADGSPLCPVHKRELQEGAHGLFCSAKAKEGQVVDRKGYCGLKFQD